MPACHRSTEFSDFRALLVLAVCLLLTYSNSFHSGWQMDDFPNILENPAVQITALDPDSLMRAVGFSRGEGRNLSRPVTNLSFALNWMIYGANAAGYHVVNFFIHLMAAWGVFLASRGLLQAPNGLRAGDRELFGIALAAALLWALNPVQTQAVTYIVQRMASLSGAFYVWALVFYLKLRKASSSRKPLWVLGIGVFFALALGSKENALMLPASLLLVESVFFLDLGNPRARRRIVAGTAGVIGLVLMIGLAILWFTDRDPIAVIMRGYAQRPFSLTERLLTEPRVILFYISLLFWPLPSRLSIEHAFVVSRDLWQPWTTFPAIVIIAVLIFCGLASMRRLPFWSFAILFFLLNHVIESTVFPLELVFEHRNYLPSMFLFLPLCVGVWHFITRVNTNNPTFARVVAICGATLILLFGFGTHLRNYVWATPSTLWTDALTKAPYSARVFVNLAIEAARQGDNVTALKLYRHSLSLEAPRKKHFQILAFNNMGGIYFRAGEFGHAAEMYRQALAIDPNQQMGRWNLSLALVELRRFEEAEQNIDLLLPGGKSNWSFLNLKGLLCSRRGDSGEALEHLRQSLRLNPNQSQALHYIGLALSRLNRHERGDWFLRRALAHSPGSIPILTSLLENAIQSQDAAKADAICAELQRKFGLDRIVAVLRRSPVEIHDPESVVNWLAKFHGATL